jgi:hypothetical protein
MNELNSNKRYTSKPTTSPSITNNKIKLQKMKAAAEEAKREIEKMEADLNDTDKIKELNEKREQSLDNILTKTSKCSEPWKRTYSAKDQAWIKTNMDRSVRQGKKRHISGGLKKSQWCRHNCGMYNKDPNCCLCRCPGGCGAGEIAHFLDIDTSDQLEPFIVSNKSNKSNKSNIYLLILLVFFILILTIMY